MNGCLPLSVVVALLMAAAPAWAATVIPPTFDELVATAATIFVGRTVESRSEFESTSTGLSIVTHVTFSVDRVLKGHVGLQTELTFLGGTVGDVRMQVADMPQFTVGDRDLLFVSSQVRAESPLVGFAYGRFRIVRDPFSGVDEVRTYDGRSFASTAEIGQPLTPSPQRGQPMTYADFESLVRQKVAALGQR